ncbi:MAG: hypothetical protein Q7O66_20675, partial [Dehalococcoidia bacterium]|nr:hypothetical protein [Dehalococcoidia bacterium]
SNQGSSLNLTINEDDFVFDVEWRPLARVSGWAFILSPMTPTDDLFPPTMPTIVGDERDELKTSGWTNDPQLLAIMRDFWYGPKEVGPFPIIAPDDPYVRAPRRYVTSDPGDDFTQVVDDFDRTEVLLRRQYGRPVDPDL